MEYLVSFLLCCLLLTFAFLIGVKKKLYLLAGYVEKEVSNKDGLAKCVGIYLSLLGLSLIPLPFLRDWIGVSIVIGYLFIFYVCLFTMLVHTKRYTKI
ncbi:DUF3784 domain-containing protein [Alkalihalobacillus sp. AL-G]|uniref:DUF3784 domain-containing protein n=1 Tax=Alkalihalobacillus sp. AL-G TaxID=2926399 RepID=UPI00272D0802|nr:DUF3784 domain-containing protein [Alkalihalobacillus sp. AL-G]WLD94264.1 DUF3784 domain-containing protein [Alkalihalobacillus sp. AL-G]